MADEWTLVPRRTHTKNHHRGHDGKCSSHRSNPQKGTGSSGLYSAASARDSTTNHIRGTRTRSNDEGRSQRPTDDQQREEKDQIKSDILECMLALENYLQSGKDLSDPFIALMNMATAASLDEDQCGHSQTMQDYPDNEADHYANCLHLREIVAYGIGNFATERFRAPMLQLALLLLVRRWAAMNSTKQSTQIYHTNHPSVACTGDNVESHTETTSAESFQNDQRLVPIYYYDPCTLPVERELLDSTFHIHVLESNQMGKLSLESMRLEHKQKQTVEDESLSPSLLICRQVAQHSLSTLFFMPHCPMQLYCNVLWAHWYDIFPHPTETQEAYDTDNEINTSPHNFDRLIQSNSGGTSSIVVFGNSFQTYDERTISSKSRLNPTNGVLRIAPFTTEIPIIISTNADRKDFGGGEIIVDALRHLNTAFNDCSIIYFDRDIIAANSAHPERPEEWIASESENGELR